MRPQPWMAEDLLSRILTGAGADPDLPVAAVVLPAREQRPARVAVLGGCTTANGNREDRADVTAA